MKANTNKKEIIKIYLLVGFFLFPVYLFQALTLDDDAINSPNAIKLISYLAIGFYSICFFHLIFEKNEIENAIKNIIYVSISAISPYIFFLNNSLTYLYTKPSDSSTTNKLLIATLLIHIINAVITIIRAKKEIETQKLVKKEFFIEDKIYMNHPYKKDYWKNEHQIKNKIIPIFLSLLPFIYFLYKHQDGADFKLITMSLISIPFSMYIFVIIVKSSYIYIYTPIKLSHLESKVVIYKK